MASYVGDGWDRQGYIAAALQESGGDRLFDALEFTYRPATMLDCTRHDAEVAIAGKNQDIDPEAAVNAQRLVCKFVADRIVSWNLKNQTPTSVVDVAPSAAACERMNPYLFRSLYRIIRGNQVSDKKPEAEKPPISDEDQLKN
ncbi:MAG: hypothetical protein ACXWBP_11220 [Limisphaerales bacterium]